MPITEINKPQLRIHQLTKTSYDAIPGSELENDSLYAVDLELGKNGAKLLQSNISGDIEETSKTITDVENKLEGVQLNGTDLTPDANKKVNIQYATNTRYGVVKVDGVNFGIGLRSTGIMEIKKADDTKIEAKTNEYFPIVPANLDKAVMEGLGNNSLTWSDVYKQSARTTIGAGATTIEVIDL